LVEGHDEAPSNVGFVERAEADAIYQQRRDAVVSVLLALSA
jgi:hypothetical protein